MCVSVCTYCTGGEAECGCVCVRWVQLVLSGMQCSRNKSSCLEYITGWLTDTSRSTDCSKGGLCII